MNFKELHERFKDKDSPAVEGQVRWLQKQGFAQNQIERAMITVYSELEQGEIPRVWTRKITKQDGTITEHKEYLAAGSKIDDPQYVSREISSGWDLDHYLLETAKRIRTGDLKAQVAHMEQFEEKLRKKWEAAQQPKKKRGWFRRGTS